MNSNNVWDADRFQENIGFLLTKFNSLFLGDISALISDPNGNRKVSLKAITSLDVTNIQRGLLEVIDTIEEELKDNALLLLKEFSFSDAEAQAYLYSNFHSGFIRSNVINELNTTLSLLNELTALAVSHLNTLEQNSGFGGFVRGLFKGYTNPIDGVSHIFGNGSTQIEVNSSVQGFNTAAIMVGQSIDSVSKTLHDVVLDKWNSFGAMIESV